MTAGVDDDIVDSAVDEELYACSDLDSPKSFLLFAGAGSGKTRSLVSLLERLRTEKGRRLWLGRRKVRVITYTNAACDEINRRLGFDPLIEVSTIHSFCWSLIETFHTDIREWLRTTIQQEISELRALAARGRAGTKAAIDRELSITSKERRLARLDDIRTFTYSPTGDRQGRGALGHSEVLAIAADFLIQVDGILPEILVNQYPILLIDESQDTTRRLMDAFLTVQAANRERFCLGLFGDMMQRIYADGKVGLAEALPDDWARPAKVMNHRCPPRVVQLINKIREIVDGQQQRPRTDKPEGTVRFFVLGSNTTDKRDAEARIADRMAQITGDQEWISTPASYKTLTLEHHMAARRAGFFQLFEALQQDDSLRTGLLDGSLPSLRLFTNDVLPLVQALRVNDAFAVAALTRQRSPLLSAAALKAAGDKQEDLLAEIQTAVSCLAALWSDANASPTFLEVLQVVSKFRLFEIPELLTNILRRIHAAGPDVAPSAEDEAADPQDTTTVALQNFLMTPFEEIGPYADYVSGLASSATHQGVKGLEFPRVMIVIDDEEARGFLFSYEKLFGAKGKSDTDAKNEAEGKETAIDRTRRLFYVTCSRAEQSLAVAAYSANPAAVRETVIRQGWFSEDEVEMLAH
ncbi:UvrD-helicase domain-containing protein [Pseudotabrizicola alkalilacus]|uniref:DNA 3'-5' helicase II n=1 Tax=Pseudotabrizicola alkalilacus TaxID=2305252 RepID=A0A411YWG8_9RHOB|nr:UvrD-helicase domain-containing protein [Pseudotabrizicola alkalilacus]RGP35120.1 ATP-dependent helicase [Pseudotabrizicola alkalilacus]